MTKAELIERIARSRDLPPDISKKLIGQILGIAFDELASYFARARVTRSQSPRFTFPHFGTFTKKRRSARRGVNPRTLEPIQIEACNTIDFKASRELREAMNPTLRSADGSELAESWMLEPTDGASPGTGNGTRTSTAASASKATANKKKKAKARSKAARPRDGAGSRAVAVGPSKRRLTPRDDEPELAAFDPRARRASDPVADPDADPNAMGSAEGVIHADADLQASPMQRVTSRRRTRSRGTG